MPLENRFFVYFRLSILIYKKNKIIMPKIISDYRSFRAEQEREFRKITKGHSLKDDAEFESMCNRFLSSEIEISEFNSYLDRSLLLGFKDSNIFDDSGNLVDDSMISEGWFRDIIDKVDDKVKATFNVASAFFKSMVEKAKKFIKSMLSKFSTEAEKMMELTSSFFEKIMSGLEYFGDFIKKHKKGLYSILVKVSVSLGISATVSYLLSFFGPGWVASMGIKTGASAAAKKLKIGEKIAAKAVKEGKIRSYLEFMNEAGEAIKDAEDVADKQESKGNVKKAAMALGQGIIKFFKILRKFKIAILIFLGAIWIIGHLFSPFGNFLDPIFAATKMTNLSDVFNADFVASASAMPPVKVSSESIESLTVNKVSLPEIKDEHDLHIGEMQAASTQALNSNVAEIKAGLIEHPKEFCEDQAKLINDLKSHINGQSDGIDEVDTDDAAELTQDNVEKTTGEDVEDLIKGDSAEHDSGDVDGIDEVDDAIDVNSAGLKSNIDMLLRNNKQLFSKESVEKFINTENGKTGTLWGLPEDSEKVEINGYKVELDQIKGEIKDGSLSDIKSFGVNISDKDGNEYSVNFSEMGAADVSLKTAIDPENAKELIEKGYEKFSLQELRDKMQFFGGKIDGKAIPESEYSSHFIYKKKVSEEELVDLLSKINKK